MGGLDSDWETCEFMILLELIDSSELGCHLVMLWCLVVYGGYKLEWRMRMRSKDISVRIYQIQVVDEEGFPERISNDPSLLYGNCRKTLLPTK
jgi:hypothetical protein